MSLDVSRLEDSIDRESLAGARVGVVGCGGSVQLVTNLARCGVPHFVLIDPDHVASENVCRTDFLPSEVGMSKVDAVARRVKAINPSVVAETRATPLEDLDQGGSSDSLASLNLLIASTDAFAAQARVNQLALALRIPALYVGLYAHGLGGEVVFWQPGLPCFRCLLGNRYRAQSKAASSGHVLDPTSQGATVMDLSFLDAIAGQIALGLLSPTSDTRFGRLIRQLGPRNFLRVKIDPGYAFRGRDIVRDELGIAADTDTFVSWCVAARRDPDQGHPPCPDCVEAGHEAFRETPYFFCPASGRSPLCRRGL